MAFDRRFFVPGSPTQTGQRVILRDAAGECGFSFVRSSGKMRWGKSQLLSGVVTTGYIRVDAPHGTAEDEPEASLLKDLGPYYQQIALFVQSVSRIPGAKPIAAGISDEGLDLWTFVQELDDERDSRITQIQGALMREFPHIAFDFLIYPLQGRSYDSIKPREYITVFPLPQRPRPYTWYAHVRGVSRPSSS